MKSCQIKPRPIVSGEIFYYLRPDNVIALGQDPASHVLTFPDKLQKKQINVLVNNKQPAFLTYGMISHAYRFFEKDTVLFAMMKALALKPQLYIPVDE